MSSTLKRLTATILLKAEEKGKAAGWYDLTRAGYLPAEIAVYAQPVVFPNDIVYRVRQHANSRNLPIPVSCAPKRERSMQAPPEDWRAAFCSNVMRTGMHLSLTQPMLEFLCATADGVVWDRQLSGGSTLSHPCNSIATGVCLEKRGLIRRKPPGGKRVDYDANYQLTEAGEHVVNLLKSVGVFLQADKAIERQAESSGPARKERA